MRRVTAQVAAFAWVCLAAIVTAVDSADTQPLTPSCDHACLSTVMADFVSAMTSRTPESIPLADSAEVRENTRIVPLRDTA